MTTRIKSASKPTDLPTIQRQPETAVTSAPVSPPPEQEPAATLSDANATPPDEDRNWQRLETIMQRHKERLVTEETAPSAAPDTLPISAAESPAVQKQPAPQSELPPEPDKQAASGRSERGHGQAQTPTTAAGHRSPVKSVTVPAATGIEKVDEAGLETAVNDTPLPTNSALPLQEAWPVQRLASAPAPASPAVAKATTTTPPPAADTSVQERLASVPPGMPTDSSVPLLRPRRPRPQRPSVLLPLPGDPRLPAATNESQTPPPPVVQRQKEAAPLVPTEIGGLPADLWQLIGQQPPHSAAATAATGSDQAAAPPAPAADSSNYIQRQPETMGQAVEQPKESAGSDTNAEDEAEETVDVDELARQVYAQLKQQLAADKERERGRFPSDW